MKALIISEADDIINEFSEYFTSQNYDVIIYRWLMKAMDNIEEISPDLIFINATEYPRHWKILSQYVLGIEKNPKIILFASVPLSNEDNEKAKYLKIDSIVSSSEDLLEVCSLDDVYEEPEVENTIEETEILENKEENFENEISNEPLNEEIEILDNKQEIPEKVIQPTLSEKKVCKFLFSNPETFVLITGKVIDFACPKFVFVPDNPEDTKNLVEKTIIKKCTLKIDDKIHIVDVEILKNDSNLEILICK